MTTKPGKTSANDDKKNDTVVIPPKNDDAKSGASGASGDNDKKDALEFKWSFAPDDDGKAEDKTKEEPKPEEQKDEVLKRLEALERENNALKSNQLFAEDLKLLEKKYGKTKEGELPIFPKVEEEPLKEFYYKKLPKVNSLEASYVLANFDNIIKNAIEVGKKQQTSNYELEITKKQGETAKRTTSTFQNVKEGLLSQFGLVKKEDK